jgi:two-component system, NarL family, sensor kinase
MTIEDNGLGFDATDKSKYNGMGLKNMQNRVNFLKGKIELDSKPGNGTLVSVYLPVK